MSSNIYQCIYNFQSKTGEAKKTTKLLPEQVKIEKVKKKVKHPSVNSSQQFYTYSLIE